MLGVRRVEVPRGWALRVDRARASPLPRAKHWEGQADEWDALHQAQAAEAERQAAVAADPMTRTARDWCENWAKVAPPDFAVEIAGVQAFASTCSDGSEAWNRIDAVQTRIRVAEDTATARKLADAGASRQAFVDAASAPEERQHAFDAAKPKPEPARSDDEARVQCPSAVRDRLDRLRAGDARGSGVASPAVDEKRARLC